LPKFRWLVVGLYPRRSWFNPRPVPVGFMVDRVALGQVFFFDFAVSVLFHQCSTLRVILILSEAQAVEAWECFKKSYAFSNIVEHLRKNCSNCFVLFCFSLRVWQSSHCCAVSSLSLSLGRGQLKCDVTRAETRFRLSVKRTSPFITAGALVQSTTGSRGVRISGSNARYTVFRGSVKGTGYPLHSPVSPSLPLSCVTVCHHISTGLYCWIHHVPR